MGKLWPGLAANLAAAAFGYLVRWRIPARVVTHWNLAGQPNGWSPRGVLLVLLPALAMLMAVVFVYAPRLDPKRRNFPLHAGSYWVVANAVLLLLAATHVCIVGFNLGWPIRIGAVLGVGLGLLFVVIGNVLTRVRPNWIFGIRTPWTLSSDLSWRETHRIGGYGFVAVGLLLVLAGLARPAAVGVVTGAGVGSVGLFAVIWSYFAWKRDPAAQGRDA